MNSEELMAILKEAPKATVWVRGQDKTFYPIRRVEITTTKYVAEGTSPKVGGDGREEKVGKIDVFIYEQ